MGGSWARARTAASTAVSHGATAASSRSCAITPLGTGWRQQDAAERAHDARARTASLAGPHSRALAGSLLPPRPLAGHTPRWRDAQRQRLPVSEGAHGLSLAHPVYARRRCRGTAQRPRARAPATLSRPRRHQPRYQRSRCGQSPRPQRSRRHRDAGRRPGNRQPGTPLQPPERVAVFQRL